MSRDKDQSASHTSSVRQIIEAAQNTWQALLQLQASDQVNPDGVFIDGGYRSNLHPQKKAHSHLLGYHQLIANKTYTVRAQDMWEQPVKTEGGHTYRVEVPEHETVYLDNETLELANIETTHERITLETLNHRWGMRYITVNKTVRGSYGSEERDITQRRLWLPPKGLQLAFEQLEDVRASVGLAAELGTPDYHETTVLDPEDGVREPYEDQE